MLARLRVEPFGVLVRDRHGELLEQLADASRNTGAACANSGKTTRRTGRNGALPATAESIIDSMRSVFPHLARSSGLAQSVWQRPRCSG